MTAPAKTDRQFVRVAIINAFSFGSSAGIFFMLGLQDIFRGRMVGWLELGALLAFGGCFVVIYRRASKRFPDLGPMQN
jgi:hypothetical protein